MYLTILYSGVTFGIILAMKMFLLQHWYEDSDHCEGGPDSPGEWLLCGDWTPEYRRGTMFYQNARTCSDNPEN